jgi:hypothetical protein
MPWFHALDSIAKNRSQSTVSEQKQLPGPFEAMISAWNQNYGGICCLECGFSANAVDAKTRVASTC